MLLKGKRALVHSMGFLIQRGKKGGISLFPVSERSMHFNSSPPQVDLSPSHGPEREGKVKRKKAGGAGGLLVRNGA